MTASRAAAGVPEVKILDTSRLSQGEKIVAICSGLLVLFSFFPLWAKYEYDFGGISDSERYSAWSDAFTFLSKLAILLALTVLVLVILRGVGKNLNLPTGLIYVGLGGLTSLLMLLLVITGPREIGEIPGVGEIDLQGLEQSFEVSRGIMLFVGLALAIGMLIGGYLHMQSEADAPVTPSTPPPAS
jgi:amino acid transporter